MSSFISSIYAYCRSHFSSDPVDDNEATRSLLEHISPEDSSLQGVPASTAKPIKLKEIKRATRNFHAGWLLGEGRFGHVFQGWIHEDSLTAAKPGSGMAVAVKKWNSFQCYEAELNNLSQLRHPNLVKLIGHCSEKDNFILVYEFIARGSLGNHLFRRESPPLSWATRIKVATGVARALSFLHDRENQVIHGRVKSGDILLDGEFNAKLSDFSLANYRPSGDMANVSTRFRGTYGYPAPEYIATGHMTVKCDVFGFGIVLLELLAGRRAWDKTRVANERDLLHWAKPYMPDKGKLFWIMDAKLEGQYPPKAAYGVAALALRCLNPDPKERPNMSEVVDELEKL